MVNNEGTQTLITLGSPDTPVQINNNLQQWLSFHRQGVGELQRQINPDVFADGKIVYLPLSDQVPTTIFYKEKENDQKHPTRHLKGADDSGLHDLVFISTATAKFAPGLLRPAAEYIAYDAVTAAITEVTPGKIVTKNSTFDEGMGSISTIGIIGHTSSRENNINKTNGVLLWISPSFETTGYKQS